MSEPNWPAIDAAIDCLNEALSLDYDAVESLMRAVVPCNSLLAKHPSIQVHVDADSGECVLRPLGLINGLFGTTLNGWGYIVMEVEYPDDQEPSIYADYRIKRFRRTYAE